MNQNSKGGHNRHVLQLLQPHDDGYGAQLLRILNAYCISRKLGLGLHYKDIRAVDNQIFNSNLIEIPLWNSFLQAVVPRIDESDLIGHREITHKRQNYLSIRSVVRALKVLNVPSKHVINSPQSVINKNPEFLEALSELNLQNFLHSSEEKNSLRVVVHIRRGEIMLSQYRDRYLPLSYFERVLQTVLSSVQERHIDVNILIPQEHGLDRELCASDEKIVKSLRVDPLNPYVKVSRPGYYRILQEMPSKEKTPLLMQAYWQESVSPWQVFRSFLEADILVLSKSSFSYSGALLNRNAVVVYHPFWHPPLKTWQTMKDTAALNKAIRTKHYDF